MSQADLKSSLYTKLTADQSSGTLYDGVGGRIYEGQVDQSVTTLPVLVYNVITDAPFETFTASHIDAEVQFDLYVSSRSNTASGATGKAAASVLNDKLITLLHRQTFAITNHALGVCFFTERGVLTIEEDAIRIRSECLIHARKT